MSNGGVLAGTISMASRNLVRSFRRRWPSMVILAAAVAVLEIGNSFLDNATDGLRRTYTRSLAGDWTISAKGRESFTLFGSDLPLIGEYYVLPSIPEADSIIAHLKQQPGVTGVIGQVTAGGIASLGSWSLAVPVFGVKFDGYFSLFPDLKLLSGSLETGPGRVLVNESQFDAMTKELGRRPELGESLTITTFNDSSFTIRAVKLAGVYRYPARDEGLDRFILTDPDTARALNGYVYGARSGGETAVGTTAADIGSLFDDPRDVTAVGSGLSLRDVEARLSDTRARDAQNLTLTGSWNFILVRGERPASDLVVRDWKDSVGGTALVTWLIQMVFNVSLGAVLFGAAVIGINSLALAVSERTREIGTMRALGAGRLRVASFVGTEVLLSIAGAGFVGVGVGALTLTCLGIGGIAVANPYLEALFGTAVLRPHLSPSMLIGHFLLSVVLGLIAVVQPVRLALRITPAAAMARGN